MQWIRCLRALAVLPIAAGGLLLGQAGAPLTDASAAVPSMRAHAPLRLPLSFEVNRGQAPRGVAFLSHTGPYTALFSPDRVTLALGRSVTVTLSFSGAASRPQIVGLGGLPGRVNYLIGRDPGGWHTDIPTYRGVRYRNLYPGIDLLYHGGKGGLEYDWVARPGARLDAVRLHVAGARPVLTRQGDLELRTTAGTVMESAPRAYQRITGRRVAVRAGFVLAGGEIGLRASGYDADRTLVVDPVIGYATYFGGRGTDTANSIAVDAHGNAYVAGTTGSPDLPLVHSFQRFHPSEVGSASVDVFVCKLNPSGKGLIFSTYLGGSSFDESYAVAQDATGVYVAGETGSRDFPLKNAFQPTFGGGGSDAFVAKLTPSGDGLIYSSYFGGPGDDRFYGLTVDTGGDAYATGDAQPLTAGGGANGPFRPPHVAVVKVGSAGNLLYSKVLAGSEIDAAFGIAVDREGNAYVAGLTSSNDFPSPEPVPPPRLGPFDAFVVKLDPTGTALLYSTRLGGTDAVTVANGITADAQGNTWVVGQTNAANFPLVGGFQLHYAGGTDSRFAGDGYIVRLDPYGRIRYSTYLGGSRDDEVDAVALDARGNAWVTGTTDSADFPVKAAIQPAFTGAVCTILGETYPCEDAFVAEITSGGKLAFCSYLGGSGPDFGTGIATAPTGAVFVDGITASRDLPTVHALRSTNTSTAKDQDDAFILQLLPGSAPRNTAIAIEQVQLLHRVRGRFVPTTTVRVGEAVHVLVVFRDRRGAHREAVGTIVVSRRGHEILQGSMGEYRANGRDTLRGAVSFTDRSQVGPLVARIAVIVGGATAIRTVRFALRAQ